MNEQNKEKLIANLEKGTEVFLVLNDDTGIIGVVERNVLCWEETDGNWHELTVYVGGLRITINSNDIKEVRKCITHTEDEQNQIIGKDVFEIYNIPYGLSDVDFIKIVLDSWDELEDDTKEEITDIIAPSLTSAMLKDILGAYAVVNKDNKRLHGKVMELLDDLEKEINKKTQDDKKTSYDTGKTLAGVLGVCSLASTILNAMDKVTTEKE